MLAPGLAYFYGKDGSWDDLLSATEIAIAPVLKRVSANKKFDDKDFGSLQSPIEKVSDLERWTGLYKDNGFHGFSGTETSGGVAAAQSRARAAGSCLSFHGPSPGGIGAAGADAGEDFEYRLTGPGLAFVLLCLTDWS